jgi:2-keto-4-pentenoate hydratase/2-oxohepta-3-ene-1,7-dioic acid hydratase in catechol pathway
VTCTVDGQLRQRGHTGDLAFSIPFLVSYISHVMTLEPGDVIATGSPEGVGELPAGCEVDVEVRAGGRVLSAVRNPVE